MNKDTNKIDWKNVEWKQILFIIFLIFLIVSILVHSYIYFIYGYKIRTTFKNNQSMQEYAKLNNCEGHFRITNNYDNNTYVDFTCFNLSKPRWKY